MNRKFYIDMFIEECGDVSGHCSSADFSCLLQLQLILNKKILDDTIAGIDALANIGNAVNNTANDAQYVTGPVLMQADCITGKQAILP